MPTYRQLIKATNKYINNKKFCNYLKSFYKANWQQNTSFKYLTQSHKQTLSQQQQQQQLSVWIDILVFLSSKRQSKSSQKQIQNKVNLNYSFVTYNVFTIDENDKQQLNNSIVKKYVDFPERKIQRLFKIYSLCQIFYLRGEKSLHTKKIGTLSKDFHNLMSKQKLFSIEKSRKIIFL